jgi:hypothetical protein
MLCWTRNSLTGILRIDRGSLYVQMDEERLDGWKLYVEGRERDQCRFIFTKWSLSSTGGSIH